MTCSKCGELFLSDGPFRSGYAYPKPMCFDCKAVLPRDERPALLPDPPGQGRGPDEGQAMICDGCWVQGDGPHECQLTVERPTMIYPCSCDLDPSCAQYGKHMRNVERYATGAS